MNLQKRFLALIPDAPLLVGDVLAVSDGIAQIELPGGGLVHARGEATAGQRVFVRDGAIEGQAPALDYVEAEV